MSTHDEEMPRFVPPARRATDRYMGVGLSGVAGLAWIVTVRVILRGEYLIASVYGLCALAVTVGAVGIVRLVILYRLQQRRRATPSVIVKPPG
jgi:hypothetical protein